MTATTPSVGLPSVLQRIQDAADVFIRAHAGQTRQLQYDIESVWRRVLWPYLQLRQDLKDATPPIRITRDEVKSLLRRVTRCDPESESARRRQEGMLRLLHGLEDSGFLQVARVRILFKRFRDYAVPPTEQIFSDAGYLADTLWPQLEEAALRQRIVEWDERGHRGGHRRLSEREEAIAVIAVLIWDGPILVRHAPRYLSTLRVGQYAWAEGYLRLVPKRTEEDEVEAECPPGGPVAQAPLRLPSDTATEERAGSVPEDDGRKEERPDGVDGAVEGAQTHLRFHLRPGARLLLNAYLERRIASGAVDLANANERIFPRLAGGKGTGDEGVASSALTRFLRMLLRGIHPEPERWTAERFVMAARERALDFFPPVIVAITSRRTHYSPAPDGDVLQLRAPACPIRDPGMTLPFPRTGMRRHPIPWPILGPDAERPVALVTLYNSLHERLEMALTQLGNTPVDDVKEMAWVLLTDLDTAVAGCRRASVELENLHYVLRWLVWQLENLSRTPGRERLDASVLAWPKAAIALPKIEPTTIRSRMEDLAAIVLTAFGDEPLWELDEEHWLERTYDAMERFGRSAQSKRAIRYRMKAFQQYLANCEQTRDREPFCEVAWEGQLPVGSEIRSVPFLLSWEIESIRADLRLHAETPAFARVLDMFVLLCAHAGLRRREACELRLKDVHIGIETLIRVGRSKTRAGRGRFVPVDLLFPADDLRKFHEFVVAQRAVHGRNPEARLLSLEDPCGFSSDEIGSTVNAVIEPITGKRATCHSLRHSFISLFPLRFFVAYFGRGPAWFLDKLLDMELFSAEAGKRFKGLFNRSSSEGTTPPLTLFHVLAILVGHAGPEVTIGVYSQTMDWLQRLYIDLQVHLGRVPKHDVASAALAIRRDERTVRNHFVKAQRGRRERYTGIACQELVAYQVTRFGQITRRPPSRRKIVQPA